MFRLIINNVRYASFVMIRHFDKIFTAVLYNLNLYEEEQNGAVIRPYFNILNPIQKRDLNQMGFFDQVNVYGVIFIVGYAGFHLALDVAEKTIKWSLRLVGPKKTFREGNRVFQYRAFSDLEEQKEKWKEEDKKLLEEELKERQDLERAISLNKERQTKKRQEHAQKIHTEMMRVHQINKMNEPLDKLQINIFKMIQDMESSKVKVQHIAKSFTNLKRHDFDKIKENIVSVQKIWLRDQLDKKKKMKNNETEGDTEISSQKFLKSTKVGNIIFDEKSSRELEQCYRENLIILPGKFVGNDYVLQTNKIGPETLTSLIKKVRNLLKNLPIYEFRFNILSNKIYSLKEVILENTHDEFKKISDEYHARLKSLIELHDRLIDLKNKVFIQYNKFNGVLLESHQKFKEENEAIEQKMEMESFEPKVTRAIRLSKKHEKRLQQKSERLANLDNIHKTIRSFHSLQSSNLSSSLNEEKTKQESVHITEAKLKKENLGLKYRKLADSFCSGPYSRKMSRDTIVSYETRINDCSDENLTTNCAVDKKLNSEKHAFNPRYRNAINEVEVYLKDMQTILESLGISTDEQMDCRSSCNINQSFKMDDMTNSISTENSSSHLISPEVQLFYIKAEIYCLLYLTSSIMEKIKKGPLRSVFPDHIPRQFRDAIYHNPSFRNSFENEEGSENNVILEETKRKNEKEQYSEHAIVKYKECQSKMRHVSLELLTYLRKFFNRHFSGQQMELEAAKLASLILRGEDYKLSNRGHVRNNTSTCKRKMKEAIAFLDELDSRIFSNAKSMAVKSFFQTMNVSAPLQSLVLSYADDFSFANEKADPIQIVLNGSYALAVGELGAYFTEYCQRNRENNIPRRDRDFPMFKRAIKKYNPELSNKLRHAEISLDELQSSGNESSLLLKNADGKQDERQLRWLSNNDKKDQQKNGLDPSLTQYSKINGSERTFK